VSEVIVLSKLSRTNYIISILSFLLGVSTLLSCNDGAGILVGLLNVAVFLWVLGEVMACFTKLCAKHGGFTPTMLEFGGGAYAIRKEFDDLFEVHVNTRPIRTLDGVAVALMCYYMIWVSGWMFWLGVVLLVSSLLEQVFRHGDRPSVMI
jgi:hypothetical protein